jgi:hypothetical protein
MGWSNLGFFNPFGVVGLLASQPMYTYGYDFTYRGTRYLYNGAGDCYEVAPTFYNGNPFSIAQVPPAVPTKPRWSVDAINRKPVSPGAPHLPPGRVGPIVAQDASPGAATSPTYRQRGLLTDDDGSTIPGRRGPRAQPMDHGFTRPAIQQMVERRVRDESRDNGNDGNNGGSSGSRSAFRGQPSEGTNRGWTSRTAESGSYNPPRVHTDASGYHGGNGASGGSAGSSGGGYSGTHAAPTGGSRTPSSSSSGGSFGGGGGGGASSSSSSGSAGASSSSSAGSSSGSSGGGSPIKPPKQ